MKTNRAIIQKSLIVATMVLAATGRAHGQEPRSAWTMELGVAGARAATLPVDVALSSAIQVSGRTELASGMAGRVAFGRQFERLDDQGKPAMPWRVEVEAWQHRADRQSISVGLLKVPRSDSVEHSALLLNALIAIAQSDARGAQGQPDWRAWVGVGAGVRQTRVPDASSSACQCLPARSDTGGIGQLKFQIERRLGEGAFIQAHVSGLRVSGTSTESGRFPLTRYGDQSIGEFGLALRWVWN
jgi:hypothetical protein